MSKNRKYGRIDSDDLFRYLSDEMSDEERNALEREAQRDPFVADALEGLSVPGARDAQKDINRLKARLEKRVGMWRSVAWLPVAASVAVLVTLGTLYFTVFSDRLERMDRRIAGTESVEPAREEEPAEEMAEEETLTEETPTKKTPAEEKPKETTPAQKKPGEERRVTVLRDEAAGVSTSERGQRLDQGKGAEGMEQEAYDESSESSETPNPDLAEEASEGLSESLAAGPEEVAKEEPDKRADLAQPTVLAEDHAGESAAESVEMDLAGKPETTKLAQEKMIPEGKDIEATVTGETITKVSVPEASIAEVNIPEETAGAVRYVQSEARTKSAAPAVRPVTDSIPAMPVGGMEQFKHYIENNLRFPEGENLPEEGIIKLSFTLDPQGHPSNILVEDSPNDAFDQEAIRLLREGPAWTPAFLNGESSREKIRIQIEFHRN